MSHVTKFVLRTLAVVFFLLMALPMVKAQDSQDLDAYKWRISTMWWFSHPTGNVRAADNQESFSFNQDFGFGNYSTFTGAVDWHFKRKHHFTFSVSPVYSSRSATITRDIVFQGVTYQAGLSVSAGLNTLSFTPGYQWDFIRRNHGYLALVVAANLLDTTASLNGTGTLNDVTGTYKRSASLLAPLPIVGPKGRWYPMHNSNRLSFDASLEGMYFFGYGSFLSSQESVQIKLSRNVNFKAGYQLGTRFSIQGQNDNIGLRLTQQGPVAGLEFNFR